MNILELYNYVLTFPYIIDELSAFQISQLSTFAQKRREGIVDIRASHFHLLPDSIYPADLPEDQRFDYVLSREPEFKEAVKIQDLIAKQLAKRNLLQSAVNLQRLEEKFTPNLTWDAMFKETLWGNEVLKHHSVQEKLSASGTWIGSIEELASLINVLNQKGYLLKKPTGKQLVEICKAKFNIESKARSFQGSRNATHDLSFESIPSKK